MDEQVIQNVVAQPSGQTEQVSPEVVVPEAAQPEVATTQVEEQAQSTVAEPVLTEQKVLELVNKAAKQAAAETLREIQSRTDKAERRIKTEVQAQIDRLANIGVSLSPEQISQMEAQARQSLAPQEPANQPLNVVASMQLELEKEYGIELTDDDLEAKLVVVDDSPTKFLRTYEKALQAKKDRLGKSARSVTPSKVETEKPDVKARVVTSPAKGAVGLTVSDPDQLLNQVYKQ